VYSVTFDNDDENDGLHVVIRGEKVASVELVIKNRVV
jgi:hypothetical protein